MSTEAECKIPVVIWLTWDLGNAWKSYALRVSDSSDDTGGPGRENTCNSNRLLNSIDIGI
jgi:hypothetical protein